MSSAHFTRKPVIFTSAEVFDKQFRANIETCFCVVSKMMFKNIINIDGSIDMEQLVNVKKYELWSYIYYLYMHNNTTISEFMRMKNPSTGKADATRFYNIVYEDDAANLVPTTPANWGKGKKSPELARVQSPNNSAVRLVYFINNIIHTYQTEIVNPVIDYLNQLLKKEIITKLTGVKVNLNGDTNRNVRVGIELE